MNESTQEAQKQNVGQIMSQKIKTKIIKKAQNDPNYKNSLERILQKVCSNVG